MTAGRCKRMSSRDLMYRELYSLLARWAARGIDEETILSRYTCVAIQAMKHAGVSLEAMVELVELHYATPVLPDTIT